VPLAPKLERRLGRAVRSFERLGSNPRVPLSTCDGHTAFRPRGIDLLIPIRLANLSSEESLLAGPVTVVGKLVRAVRKPGQEYADGASLATFSGPTEKLDAAESAPAPKGAGAPEEGLKLDEVGSGGLGIELTADAVVLAPGAVILPVAIYK